MARPMISPVIAACVLITATLVLVMGTPLARADRWDFFEPEFVTSYSCQTTSVIFEVYGDPKGGTEYWVSTAHAKRSAKVKDWTAEVARFPRRSKYKQDIKERHKAEKACSVWTDQAGEKVLTAQGLAH